ncbi:MAG: SpoIIE family protein phosphatase [Brumimicrobium sp.]
MSNLLSKILGNITTRIMFIIYITIILVTGFFIVFGYYNQLSLQEERQYDKLQAIVTSIAVNLNGDAIEEMMNKHPNKGDIKDVEQDSIYQTINTKLSKAVKLNNLNSAMYTLHYSPDENVFLYGVRSDDYIDFRNAYKKYPPILREKMKVGGTIPMYESENGIWISAFHPLFNLEGEVVGLLEADIDFTMFKSMVNSIYLQQALIAIGVVLLIALILIPYSRKILREDDRKKKLFMQQKLIIEESHREIKDSISYAKRIQSAILPPSKIVKESIQESFILYKPKDIVAGDFYWMETFVYSAHPNKETESIEITPKKGKRSDSELKKGVLFAACDCTGHGVPGAMVSVICNNALNRSVREYKLTDPGEILDKSREIVIEEFEKSDDDVKDGMDISLVSFRLLQENGKRKALIKWAGANNPLWILKNDKKEFTEIKPDKQPIGKYAKTKPFTTHEFTLEEDEMIYLLTDGYQDQFGGTDEASRKSGGKKFKTAPLKSLLLSIRNEPMEMQKEIIDTQFEAWKGTLDQVDDVCIIGLRI